MPEEIHKAAADAAINIENKVCLLLGRELLHFEGIVEHGVRWEVLEGKLFEDGDSFV